MELNGLKAKKLELEQPLDQLLLMLAVLSFICVFYFLQISLEAEQLVLDGRVKLGRRCDFAHGKVERDLGL